jgi:AcrR family transcriptional regulator
MTTRPKATSRRPARRRDATATRASILSSARQAFAELGYDGAGVREIAQGAGVTAMLINRYFGSKERLFAEVIAGIMAEPVLLTTDRLSAAQGDLGFADALVTLTAADGPRLDRFRIMCRAASSAAAAAVGREQIEARHLWSGTPTSPEPLNQMSRRGGR